MSSIERQREALNAIIDASMEDLPELYVPSERRAWYVEQLQAIRAMYAESLELTRQSVMAGDIYLARIDREIARVQR